MSFSTKSFTFGLNIFFVFFSDLYSIILSRYCYLVQWITFLSLSAIFEAIAYTNNRSFRYIKIPPYIAVRNIFFSHTEYCFIPWGFWLAHNNSDGLVGRGIGSLIVRQLIIDFPIHPVGVAKLFHLQYFIFRIKHLLLFYPHKSTTVLSYHSVTFFTTFITL